MVEAGFSHANISLTKQNRLDFEERGDLRLKLASHQSDIIALAVYHRKQPSH